MRTPMPFRALPAPFLLVLTLMTLAGCAGMSTPPQPLWDPGLYDTIAVLPVRMTVLTGRELFKSEDTDLSDMMGGLMQESLSTALRLKGYGVLAPEDLSERLFEEDDLSEAFFSVAGAYGFMGDEGQVSREEAMEGAALIGEKLGADLLVIAHGNGEYHSFEETLFQSMVTGFITKGREVYDTPPSFLRADIFFVDGAEGVGVARILPRSFPFEKDLVPLTRRISRLLGRVPEKKTAPAPGGGQ